MVCTPASDRPKCFTLPACDQFLDRSCDVFDRHVRIDTVLIKQIDRFHVEPLQRRFGHLPDVLRTTVQAGAAAVRSQAESELGGNDDLLSKWSESFADKLFVCPRTVNLGRIEKGDPKLDGRADQRNSHLLVNGRSEAMAETHAPQTERRHFKIAFSQLSFLHIRLCKRFKTAHQAA